MAVFVAAGNCSVGNVFEWLDEILELSVLYGAGDEACPDCHIEVGLVRDKISICPNQTKSRFAFQWKGYEYHRTRLGPSQPAVGVHPWGLSIGSRNRDSSDNAEWACSR